MGNEFFGKIITAVLLMVLIILSFFLIKPILLSIISAVILAFIFAPIYNRIFKITNSKNFSASLICLFLIIMIILPFWFFTPIIIKQSFKVYLFSQQIDFIAILKKISPSFFASEEFTKEVGSILYSFTNKVTNSTVNLFSKLLLNLPNLFLHFLIVFFTLFFTLKDKEKIILYIQSILPFSKDVEKKLFESSKGITISVIYGQVIVGIIQGIIAGAGFLIFGAPNALFLTFLALVAGIFPVIGTAIVWLPVGIYFFIAGNTFQAWGIITFGIISSTIDNLIRPAIVSKRTMMHPALILIGMVGGLLLFGILGFILGPLILAYLFIILEIYRDKRIPGVLYTNPNNKV